MGNLKSVTLTENIIGWLGTLLIVVAYFLNALGFVSSTGLFYSSFNLIGAMLAGYVAVRYGNYQSGALNFVWVIVAIIGISRLFFR